jgi:hypothetical protein
MLRHSEIFLAVTSPYIVTNKQKFTITDGVHAEAQLIEALCYKAEGRGSITDSAFGILL